MDLVKYDENLFENTTRNEPPPALISVSDTTAVFFSNFMRFFNLVSEKFI